MASIKLCDPSQCTGCMACAQICSQDAIDKEFVNGFSYPVINNAKCIGCGLCMNVCPVLNLSGRKGNTHESELSCWAVYSKNDRDRMNSSSGGVFTVIAEAILSEKGVVFGAAWNDHLELCHEGIESNNDLDRLRRSKYVQSDTGETFKEVKHLLDMGRRVLYCGTPCQLAGLHSYLRGREYNNLFTVDVLCQGVPSPWAFRKYIKEIEVKTRKEVVDCNFRTKKYGWRCGLLLLLLVLRDNETGKLSSIQLTKKDNSFYRSFLREYFMRPSCYDCQFKNNHQGYYSDLTIADFWRIGNSIPLDLKNIDKGVSAVIINTEKGKSLFESCKLKFDSIERSWQEFSTNGGLRSSRKPSNNDEAFVYLLDHSWAETQDMFFPLKFREILSIEASLLFGESFMRRIKSLLKR